jgi:hypothetical protein
MLEALASVHDGDTFRTCDGPLPLTGPCGPATSRMLTVVQALSPCLLSAVVATPAFTPQFTCRDCVGVSGRL